MKQFRNQRKLSPWIFLIGIALLMPGIMADYLQLSWDVPYRDVQHTSQIPSKGPNLAASRKWKTGMPISQYAVPFTVAGHFGHTFVSDSKGSLYAFDTINKGRQVWSYDQPELVGFETVDVVPIVTNSNQYFYHVASAACLVNRPYPCIISVVNHEGVPVWILPSQSKQSQLTSTSSGSSKIEYKPTPAQNLNSKKGANHPSSNKLEDVKKIDNSTDFPIQIFGRVYQILPALDGAILIVPVCPAGRGLLREPCIVYAMNALNGEFIWSYNLAGPLRGNLLVSKTGLVLALTCTMDSVAVGECVNSFEAFQVTDGTPAWQHVWNGSDVMQVMSRFTGLIVDNKFITVADDVSKQSWAIALEMRSGRVAWKQLLDGVQGSRSFLACAGDAHGKDLSHVYIMAGGKLTALNTHGNIVWVNFNYSKASASMAIDAEGSIYVGTSRKRGSESYFGALDVYDARNGDLDFTIEISDCHNPVSANATIIPTFTITSERWIIVMCQSNLIALYSPAVPIWGWVLFGIAFASIMFSIFAIGYRINKRMEASEELF